MNQPPEFSGFDMDLVPWGLLLMLPVAVLLFRVIIVYVLPRLLAYSWAANARVQVGLWILGLLPAVGVLVMGFSGILSMIHIWNERVDSNSEGITAHGRGGVSNFQRWTDLRSVSFQGDGWILLRFLEEGRWEESVHIHRGSLSLSAKRFDLLKDWLKEVVKSPEWSAGGRFQDDSRHGFWKKGNTEN